MKTTMLHISSLEPHPANVRDEIGDVTETAASILAHGILQPLAVIPREGKTGYYWVIAGNRRYHAARRARLDQLPCVIRRDPLTAAQVTEIMLIENWQREDLNPVEKARGLGRLKKAGKSNSEIARLIGVHEGTVSYFLTLLDLDDSTQERVKSGQIAMGDAVAAVRANRRLTRKKSGRKPVGATWEPDHFTDRHPLARKAREMCEAREHTMRRRLGKIACGQCWETVIRADERQVSAVTAQPVPNGVMFRAPGMAGNGSAMAP